MGARQPYSAAKHPNTHEYVQRRMLAVVGRVPYCNLVGPAPVHFKVIVTSTTGVFFDGVSKFIVSTLRQAGFQAIHLDPFETSEIIVNTAHLENADAIGVSSRSGEHLKVFLEILDQMAARDMKQVLLFGFGTIPPTDADELIQRGVGRLFGPGTNPPDIVKYLAEELPRRRVPPK